MIFVHIRQNWTVIGRPSNRSSLVTAGRQDRVSCGRLLLRPAGCCCCLFNQMFRRRQLSSQQILQFSSVGGGRGCCRCCRGRRIELFSTVNKLIETVRLLLLLLFNLSV